MEIDNNKRGEIDEQQRIEKSREKNRKDVERRQQQDGAKAFAAKLAQKTQQDVTRKDMLSRNKSDKRKSDTKEGEASLMERLLGAAKENQQAEAHGKVDRHQEALREDHRTAEAKDEFREETSGSHEATDTKSTVKDSQFEKVQTANEDHRRIDDHGQQGGQGGGQGGDAKGGGAQQGMGGGGFSGDRKDNAPVVGGDGKPVKGVGTFSVRQSGTGTQGRFQGGSQQFTQQDLDGIVASVQLTQSGASGGARLTVQLENAYFEGLAIEAEQTPQGTVIKFICPNTAVRSTFVRYRPQVYEHFKAKGIAVFRIDIV